MKKYYIEFETAEKKYVQADEILVLINLYPNA